jgi:hypothetical protein
MSSIQAAKVYQLPYMTLDMIYTKHGLVQHPLLQNTGKTLVTFEFHLIQACLPETSGSFKTRLFVGTLPIVRGFPGVLVKTVPIEGPETTFRVKILPV